MTRAAVSQRVLADRVHWIEKMLSEIRALPLAEPETFFADTRNIWAAESCLRRALEALLDLGRHILAKAFATGVSEYKQIADGLVEKEVLDAHRGEMLRIFAGYRNRLVHFYHEVSGEELYRICSSRLPDIEVVLASIKLWLRNHPEHVDREL